MAIKALHKVRRCAPSSRELASPEPSPSEPIEGSILTLLMETPKQSVLRPPSIMSSPRSVCSQRSVKTVTFAEPLSDFDTLPTSASQGSLRSDATEPSVPFHERFRETLKEYRAAREQDQPCGTRTPTPVSSVQGDAGSTLKYIRSMNRRH